MVLLKEDGIRHTKLSPLSNCTDAICYIILAIISWEVGARMVRVVLFVLVPRIEQKNGQIYFSGQEFCAQDERQIE